MEAFVHGLIVAVNGVLRSDVSIALLLVWAMAATSMRLMAIISLVAILAPGKYVHAAWRDDRRQRAQRIADPVVTCNTIPALARVLPAGVWGEHGALPRRPAPADAMRGTRGAVRAS